MKQNQLQLHLEIDSEIVFELNQFIQPSQQVQKLKTKYKDEQIIYEQLIKIIKASALMDSMENIAGKAMLLLRKMFKIVQWEDFSKIRLSNCSMKGLTFIYCQFQKSQMNYVEIIGCQFMSCCLDNVKWENMISYEQRVFRNPKQIISIKLSPDGTSLISQMEDQSSLFWDLKSGNKILSILEINQYVKFEIIRVDLALQINPEKVFLKTIRSGKMLKIFLEPLDNSKIKETSICFHQVFFVTGLRRNNLFKIMISGKLLRKIPKKGKLQFNLKIHSQNLIFSPTQEILAFVKYNQIEWWNVKQKVLLKKIFSYQPDYLQFSLDGFIFSYYNANYIYFYYVKTGQQFLTLNSEDSPYIDLNFPNNKCILKQEKYNVVLVDPLYQQFQYYTPEFCYKKVFFLSDGKRLLVEVDDKHSFIFNLINGQNIQNKLFKLSQYQIIGIQSQLSLFILQSKIDHHQIQFYNFEQEKITNSLQLQSKISAMTISLDQKFFAYGHEDCTIKLLEFQTARQLKSLAGHNNEVKVIEFSSNSEIMVSADDKNIILWNTSIGSEIKSFIHNSLTFAFSPYQNLFAFRQKSLTVWDIENDKLLPQFSKYSQNFYSQILTKVFFLSEQLLLSVFKNAYIWNIQTGDLLQVIDEFQDWTYSPQSQILVSLGKHSIQLYQNYFNKQFLHLFTHLSPLLSVKAFIKKQLLISCDQKGSLYFFDLKQKKLMEKSLLEQQPSCYTLSQSGYLLAYGCQNCYIHLLYTTTMQIINKLEGNQSQIQSLEFSNDEKLIISGNQNGQLILWEVESGNICKIFHQNLQPVTQVIFHKDNESIISLHSNQTINFWNTSKREYSGYVYNHNDEISFLALSSTGVILAFGNQIGEVCLMNIQSKEIVQEFKCHYSRVNVIAFSQDDKFLISGGDDQIICLIRIVFGCIVDKIAIVGGRVTQLGFLNDRQSFFYGNYCGDVNLITFAESNIRPIKAYNNKHSDLCSTKSSLRQAQITSQHGCDLLNVLSNQKI